MKTGKNTLLTLLIAALLIPIMSVLAADNPDAVLGTWLTDKKDSKIEIFKKNGKYYGKIIWLKEPNRNGKPKLDDNNPDEKLKKRKLLGLEILKGFEYDEDNVWEDGEIYNPRDGKLYSCKMELSEDGKVLEVRGYVGISLFGKTSVWTRVK